MSEKHVKEISKRTKRPKVKPTVEKNKTVTSDVQKNYVEIDENDTLKQKNDTNNKQNVKVKLVKQRNGNNSSKPDEADKVDNRRQTNASSRKVDHKELDKIIYNRERLNEQIQEAREAIQKQLRSMTSSVPVLLVTYMRSGSSWLGDITQQAKDSIYFFEPFQFMIEEGYYSNGLVCYYNDKCRQPLSDVESHQIIMKNLLQIYNCEINMLHPRVYRNVMRRHHKLCSQGQSTTELNAASAKDAKRRGKTREKMSNSTDNAIPSKRVSEADCLKMAINDCKNAKYRIVKTIRFSMDLVQILMDFIPSLKVIHLVRDPRGISNSRRHSAGMRMSRETDKHSIALCKEIFLDITVGDILRQKYYKRITMVMYEALAERPSEGAKYVYKFLNIKYNKNIEEWVYNSTHANRNNGFFGTQRSDASEASVHWRKQLDFSDVDIIQKHCKEVLDTLGYRSFKSETDMKNFNLTSRQSTTLKGFT